MRDLRALSMYERRKSHYKSLRTTGMRPSSEPLCNRANSQEQICEGRQPQAPPAPVSSLLALIGWVPPRFFDEIFRVANFWLNSADES